LLAGGVAARDRVASIFSLEAPTNRVRIEVWKGAFSLSGAFPVTGCGAGNFRAQYPPYRSAAEASIHDAGKRQLTEAEDPHSTHLSLLTELGQPAALLWLAWLVLLVVRGWRSGAVAPAAAVAAFAAAGCFNTLREFAPFDLWLGIWAGILARGAGEPAPRSSHLRWVELSLLLPAAFAISHSARGALAWRDYDGGMRTADAAERRDAMERAIGWRPGFWQAHYQLALTFRTVAEAAGDRSLEFHSKALEQAEVALEAEPWNLAALNLAASAATATGEVPKARELLEKAERVAPWYYLTQVNFARTEATPEGAKQRLRRALELKPSLAEDPEFMKALK
jgi:tetratricopeptide (TPR) repeat protein